MTSSKLERTVIIFNIPTNFGASDLRRFFTTFTEAEKFECFHYKRRPEDKLQGFSRQLFLGQEADGADEKQQQANVSLAVLAKKNWVQPFLDYYHMKHWTDRNHEDLTVRCLAFSLEGHDDLGTGNLSEFRPPTIAPKGNVGTPSSYFLKAINECRLSPKVIAKLGLDFSERRRRTFSAVAPPSNVIDGSSKRNDRVVPSSLPKKNSTKSNKDSQEEPIKRGEFKKPRVPKRKDTEEELEDEEYAEEEWDRHRALHNEVSARRVVDRIDDLNDQPGTKDRLFEDKMEVTWEKGGSGLVFYTDAQFWKEAEAQEEAEDADDWDVDTSEYEQPGTGDKDAQDAASMRSSDSLRQGRNRESAFHKRRRLGDFELHTRGVGRRLLESSGWNDGQGLGIKGQGRPYAVDSRGQQGRSGLGYTGESRITKKLIRHNQAPPRSLDEDQNEEIAAVRISTIYDS